MFLKYFFITCFFLCSYFFHLSASTPHIVRVVASFSVLKHWVDVLTADIPHDSVRVDVSSLVPLQNDPHIYHPTPRDSVSLAKANLIVVIGLTFEGWIDGLISSSGTKAKIITVSDGLHVRPKPFLDPHIWHDIQMTRHILECLKNELCILMPEAKHIIQNNYENYDKQLIDLDIWIKQQFNDIPLKDRKVVTTHDAFYYYGKAYDVQFFAPVGISTDDEASAKTVGHLITQIQKEGIRAIFFESIANRRLLRQIGEDAGLTVSEDVTLYSDSLSDNKGPACDYISMMKHNTNAIAKGLKENAPSS